MARLLWEFDLSLDPTSAKWTEPFSQQKAVGVWSKPALMVKVSFLLSQTSFLAPEDFSEIGLGLTETDNSWPRCDFPQSKTTGNTNSDKTLTVGSHPGAGSDIREMLCNMNCS